MMNTLQDHTCLERKDMALCARQLVQTSLLVNIEIPLHTRRALSAVFFHSQRYQVRIDSTIIFHALVHPSMNSNGVSLLFLNANSKHLTSSAAWRCACRLGPPQ